MKPHDALGDHTKSLLGSWHVAGGSSRVPGMLSRDGFDFRLKLMLFESSFYGGKISHEYFSEDGNKDDELRTFIGHSQAGIITAKGCACIHYRHGFGSKTTLEVDLIPQQVWVSGDEIKAEGGFEAFSFVIPGLHNLLSTLDMKSSAQPDSEGAEAGLREGANLSYGFSIYEKNQEGVSIVFKGDKYNVLMRSGIVNGFSVYSGFDISSKNIIWISCDGAPVEKILLVAREVRRFFDVFCMGSVVSEQETAYEKSTRSSMRLMWSLGDRPRAGVEMNIHQAWTRFGEHPDHFRAAIQKWFEGSDQRRVARRLVCDVLEQEVLSSSGFLAVAQAWEIMGRELSPGSPHEKGALTKACDEVFPIIDKYLGRSAAERITASMKSSNNPSFRDLIGFVLAKMHPVAREKICGDVDIFAKKVAAVRNALTHMKGSKVISLDDAAASAGELTLKLLVGLCVVEASSLGLPMSNLASVLRSNRLARMAID